MIFISTHKEVYGEMKIIVTAREALDGGYWEKLCGLTGINIWAVNGNQMDEDETIELTEEQAKKLGIINS